ncbi:MAG: helix-turn-helix domain-containing protein [Actinomycetota bacterium]|nr:helix-turn-helix domain-containing protein [Actinomycetota bacterium]
MTDMAEDLLSIGRLARMSGLSVKAVRHYERVGLLRPFEVDPATGYRRYAPEQVGTARTIRRLRDLDVPLARIRAILGSSDPNDARLQLEAHLAVTEGESWRLQRILHRLRRTIDGKENVMADQANRNEGMDPAEERALASDLFNTVWTLLEKPDRSLEENDRMVHAAHASRFHWGEVGEPVNLARGEWQISRVYSVLGRSEAAIFHADRCLQICRANEIGDFDLAFAYEALARAHLVAGDKDAAARFAALAREAGEQIAEGEDRELLISDLAGISA